MPLAFKRGPPGTLVPVPRRTSANHDGSADLALYPLLADAAYNRSPRVDIEFHV